MTQIPRKIHQIYWNWGPGGEFLPSEDIPHLPGVESWRTQHPGFQHLLWGRTASYNFVQQHFPEYWEVFNGYAHNVQRCDMFRIMLLARLGGIYADLDLQIHRPIDSLLDSHPQKRVILDTENIHSRADALKVAEQQPIRDGQPEHPIRLANYWLAAAPHPLLHEVLEEMRQRAPKPVNEPYDVLYTTGPDVITEVVHRAGNKYDDVVYLPRQEVAEYFDHHPESSWRF